MIKIHKSFEVVKNSIISISSDEDKVTFVTNVLSVFSINKSNWEVHPPMVLLNAQELHNFHKGVGISPDGLIGCSIKHSKFGAAICELPNIEALKPTDTPKPILKALKGHKSNAEVVAFSQHGNHIATGGSDGKIYMYLSKNGKTILNIGPMEDYISHISLSHSNEYLMYGSYDKTMGIYDQNRSKNIFKSNLNDVVESSFFFKDDQKAYAITREGLSVVVDLEKQKSSKKKLFSNWPTQAILDASQDFAIIGTRKSVLYVVDLKHNALFTSIQLDQGGISSLHLSESLLYIGFESGWIYVIDTLAFLDDYVLAMTLHNYADARKLINKNPFLILHPSSEGFTTGWPGVKVQILNQLMIGKLHEAIRLSEPFTGNETFENEFQDLMLLKTEIYQFNQNVIKKEYGLAYAAAQSYPFLKETDAYHKMELLFSKSFSEARKIIVSNPSMTYQDVKALLDPFLKVQSKRETILALFKVPHIFSEANQFVLKKDFESFFKLTLEHDFLKETEIYHKLLTMGEMGIKRVEEMVKEENFADAKNSISQLFIFYPLKEKISLLEQEINLKLMFEIAISTNDLNKVFELTEKHFELKLHKNYKKLLLEINTKIEEAYLHVSVGHIQETKTLLQPYSNVEQLKPKVISCIKQAMINKAYQCIEQSQKDMAVKIMQAYEGQFGKDDMFNRIQSELI